MPRLSSRRFSVVAATVSILVHGPRETAVGQPSPSPVGRWTTVSDEDGQPEAVVEIEQHSDGEFVGVVRGLLAKATHDDSICGKCSDERRGQPVVGMTILRHMRQVGDEWTGGEILDPESGKTYRAKMKLTDGGQKLVVRGYIGLSLFGRSQTWLRRP